MAIIIIMLITMIAMWGSLVAAYGSASMENGKYMLGITLPEQYRKEPEVQEIAAAYRRNCRRINWLGLAGCLLVFPLNKYSSLLILWIMVWFGLLMYGYNENIRSSGRRLYALKQQKGWLSGNPHIVRNVSEDGEELYGDDDEYWLNGTVSEGGLRLEKKRVGVGVQFSNTAASRRLEKMVLIVTGLFVTGLALFLMPFDFSDITMDITDGKCRVEAAGMGYTFPLEEIQQITVLEERPDMSKKNGYDSNRLNLGDFRVKGYGKCKVYVCLESETVIKVETDSGIVFFSGMNEAQTKEFAEELTEAAGIP